MKKIFILIAIILFCFFPIKNAFALMSGDILWSSNLNSVSDCINPDNIISFFLTSNEYLGGEDCDREYPFSSFQYFSPYIGDSLSLKVLETSFGCSDSYPTCLIGSLDSSTIVLRTDEYVPPEPPVIPTADAEILGWGDSLTASAKDNIFAVISENKTTIALIMIAIITIMLIFGLIRDAVKNAKYGKDGWGDGSDV